MVREGLGRERKCRRRATPIFQERDERMDSFGEYGDAKGLQRGDRELMVPLRCSTKGEQRLYGQVREDGEDELGRNGGERGCRSGHGLHDDRSCSWEQAAQDAGCSRVFEMVLSICRTREEQIHRHDAGPDSFMGRAWEGE